MYLQKAPKCSCMTPSKQCPQLASSVVCALHACHCAVKWTKCLCSPSCVLPVSSACTIVCTACQPRRVPQAAGCKSLPLKYARASPASSHLCLQTLWARSIEDRAHVDLKLHFMPKTLNEVVSLCQLSAALHTCTQADDCILIGLCCKACPYCDVLAC